VDDRQHLIDVQALLGRPPAPGPLDHPDRVDQHSVQIEQDGRQGGGRGSRHSHSGYLNVDSEGDRTLILEGLT